MMTHDSEAKDRDEEIQLSVHEETTGLDTPEGRKKLKDALQGMRDLAAQHSSSTDNEPDWKIPEATKETGRRGIAEARAALKAIDEQRAAREAANQDADQIN